MEGLSGFRRLKEHRQAAALVGDTDVVRIGGTAGVGAESPGAIGGSGLLGEGGGRRHEEA